MSDLNVMGSRVLVLGTGGRADQARRLLRSSGAQTPRRFDLNVTFVVVDRTVPADDSEVADAVLAGIPVLTTAQLRERLDTCVRTSGSPARSAPPSRPTRPTHPAPLPPPVRIAAPLPPTMRRRATGWGIFATLLVVCTAGTAAPLVVGYLAGRLRSYWELLAAGGYAISVLFAWSGAVYGYPQFVLAYGLIAFNTVVGGLHAHSLTERFWIGPGRAGMGPMSSVDVGNAGALAEVNHRRRLREEARRLAEADSDQARELRIGRPDLDRHYDDGGLIDMNSAPVAILMTIPGMTRGIAEEIVDWRNRHGPFHSGDEVMVHTSLDPQAARQIEVFALYLV